MPTSVVEGKVHSFTYEELMTWAEMYSGSNGDFNKWAAEAAKYGVGEEQALLDYLSAGQSGLQVEKMADGSYSGWFYNSVEQLSETNAINSNVSSISRGSLRQMVGQKFETVQGVVTRNMTRFPASGGLGQKASYVLGSIGSGVAAVSTGIWLGKTIDSALYNANPDFWNSIGLSSLNPETWNSITNGSDSPFAGLFNFILGINPDTGQSQMYMDANALAYMSYALAQNGIFDSPQTLVTFDSNELEYSLTHTWKSPLLIFDTTGYVLFHEFRSGVYDYLKTYSSSGSAPIYTICLQSGSNTISVVLFISEQSFTLTESNAYYGTTTTYQSDYVSGTSNYPSFYCRAIGGGGASYQMTPPNGDRYSEIVGSNVSNCGNVHADGTYWQAATNQDTRLRDAAIILFGGGHIQTSGGIEGISDQPNATLPDISNWSDIPSTLQSLMQQYPDAFDNAMVWDNDNDDGTPNQTTWIPVPFPTTTSATDTQPTSGTQTQTSLDVSQIPRTLIDLLTQIVQQPETQTQTQTQPQIPPQNPVDTGTGSSPIPSVPTGSASALWSVYHPTQAQINAFGGWLWGSVFTTDIRKLFEDPIQGVIKLHKVFATPVDSGNGTIVVGTLDSNVASATVTQQYVTVDCGSVNCFEDFGNVFDYPPFTDISLYLPFIGIVPLDTNDVMRSTIHVIYGVDVFTGACLAMVEISRDGSTVNMYQYAGVCSVDYPLSNVQASNMLSGLLTMGAGIASIVATGGISTPAAGAAIGGAAATLKRSVGRSGGFSGNSGAMGIKKPYIILERPQTKVAETFKNLSGYPTNYSCKLGDCSGHVVVKHVHVEGINATDTELSQIESLLKDGVLI